LFDDTAGRAYAPSESAGSATTPHHIVEDLEEADFYLQQGLHDEAEEVYRRILKTAPNHPHAMLRLGEIEAARGGPAHAPLETVSEPAVEAEASAGKTPPGPSAPEAPAAGFEPTGQEPTPSAGETQEDGASDFGMDFPDPSSLPGLEGVSDFDFDVGASEEDAAETTRATEDSPAPQAEQTMPLLRETMAPVDSDADETSDTGDFDLAAELSGAFDGDESGPLSGGMGGTTEGEGFEQVFAAFKQGVEQELDEGDFETHYDLGIAYKEMGLLEDAIDEFQIALGGPARKLASLHAMGLCALDLERASDAVSHLEQALALPEVPSEQQVALHFDLGRAYERQGDLERARRAYRAVTAVDPDFGGVEERLAELGSSEGDVGVDALASKREEESFESFDDRIEDVGRQLEGEGYESFDDLMSEHGDEAEEAVGQSEAPLAETEASLAETEAEPAPEPEPAPDAPAPKKPNHRKKISFV
jgi:tetratricopeptide (TPR) repeat protein